MRKKRGGTKNVSRRDMTDMKHPKSTPDSVFQFGFSVHSSAHSSVHSSVLQFTDSVELRLA